MDWLAGLPSWLAAAERTEMHRSTEQTQTCHFRRLIQSVMIFPHLAGSLFSLFTAHHAPLHFGCSAVLVFYPVSTRYRFMQHCQGEEVQGKQQNKIHIFKTIKIGIMSEKLVFRLLITAATSAVTEYSSLMYLYDWLQEAVQVNIKCCLLIFISGIIKSVIHM